MGKEIERKFRVRSAEYRRLGEKCRFRQGYLSTDPERCVRIRLCGERAFLTVKGATQGYCRDEFEYPIPAADAEAMLDRLCLRPLIEKDRYRFVLNGQCWEVDEFHGENEGLVVAEAELPDENCPLELPDWIGEEVTGDVRYYNARLIAHPYRRWKAR